MYIYNIGILFRLFNFDLIFFYSRLHDSLSELRIKLQEQTYSCMDYPSSFNGMPSFFDAAVTYPAKYKGAYPHGEVRDRSEGARRSDIEFKHISHVFWKVCYHCVITPVVAYLENKVTSNFIFLFPQIYKKSIYRYSTRIVY